MLLYLRDGLAGPLILIISNYETTTIPGARTQKLGPWVLLCSGIYNIIIAGRDL